MSQEIKKLDLERRDKLQVFAVMSASKSVPVELLKDSFALSILLTYTDSEAISATELVLLSKGKKPDDYIVDCMRVSMPVEQIVNLPELKPVPQKKETVEEYMIRNTRMVFETSGTKTEKKIAERVIAKFQEQTKKLSTV